jgi:hypothetical protein
LSGTAYRNVSARARRRPVGGLRNTTRGHPGWNRSTAASGRSTAERACICRTTWNGWRNSRSRLPRAGRMTARRGRLVSYLRVREFSYTPTCRWTIRVVHDRSCSTAARPLRVLRFHAGCCSVHQGFRRGGLRF